MAYDGNIAAKDPMKDLFKHSAKGDTHDSKKDLEGHLTTSKALKRSEEFLEFHHRIILSIKGFCF
jgi:hypothetical protein